MWFKILSFLWLLFFIVFGISMLVDTPQQIKRDKQFIEERIKPSVVYIDSFRKLHNRLPNSEEFYSWKSEMSGTIYVRSNKETPIELYPYPNNIDWNNNYVLWVWRGEWAEYYTSWNNQYIGNNSSWIDSIIGLIEAIFIGFLPFLISFLIRIINKRRIDLSS